MMFVTQKQPADSALSNFGVWNKFSSYLLIVQINYLCLLPMKNINDHGNMPVNKKFVF